MSLNTILSVFIRFETYTIMYDLKHEQECFIGYKTRGEDERFISDKARTASDLDGFISDPFYTHVISLFTKNIFKIDVL